MLNAQKEKEKRTKNKLPKIQYFKCHYSFNNFARDPRSMHEFLGVNLLYTFRGDVV